MQHCWLGFDIGGTKCAAVLGCLNQDMQVVILAREAFSTADYPAWQHALERLFTLGEAMLAQAEGYALQAVGISCGGPLDSAKGMILSPPNLLGWDHVPAVALAQARFAVKAYLQNDANACALAEWRFGAAKGSHHAIFCTFGTGMGAGLILNGKLYEGANGNAGEIGHMRMERYGPVGYGKQGSFEGFCSGGGIAQLAASMALEALQRGETPSFCPHQQMLSDITAKRVAQAAQEGDILARQVLTRCGEYLGRGLALLVDIFNPEVIVLGSIYPRSQQFLEPSMIQALQREALDASLAACRIKPAVLGDAIGDYAALAIAMQGC